MPAAVLCDGSPSALKAVELGGYPNFFIGPTDQLILIHAWSPVRQQFFLASQNAPVRSPSIPNGAVSWKDSGAPQGTPGGASSNPGATASSAAANGGAAGSPGAGVLNSHLPSVPVTTSAAEAMRNAVSSLSLEVTDAQRSRIPAPLVLHQHLRSIKESRFLKDFLNYKLETVNLPPPTSLAAKNEEEPRNQGGKGKTATRIGAAKVGKEEVPPEPLTLAEVTLISATQTAEYVRQRAVHHKLDTLLLGVGNQGEGKLITVGHTAEAVLRQLHSDFYLYFIKSEGFTMRPTSTLIRYVVVVTVGNGSPPAPPPPSFLENSQRDGKEAVSQAQQEGIQGKQKEGHHPSFTDEQDNGGGILFRSPAAQVGVVHVLETGTHASTSAVPPSASSGQPAGNLLTAKVGNPHLSAPFLGLSSSSHVVPTPPKPVDALQDGLSALRYALSRRRPGTKDAAAVLLVVEPQTDEEEVQRYASVFEQEIERAAVVQDGAGKMEVADEEVNAKENQVHASDIIVPTTEERKKSAPLVEEVAAATNTSGQDVSSLAPSSAAGDAVVPEVDSKLDEFWPPVTICTLKGTKHLLHPTVWNTTPQVIKALQSRRVEFAVFAYTAPEPLIQAVLAHHKPHAIIVPSPSSGVCVEEEIGL